jgi:protein-disulfide isomerase
MSPVRAILLNRIVIFLALAGIAVAGTLTYSHYADVIVPCGVGAGCQQVTQHPSSIWFGIPVALYGLGAYVALLGLAIYRVFAGLEATRRIGMLSYVLTGFGAMVSIGLQMYSFAVLHAFCTWCVASAVIMIALFIVQAALAVAPLDDEAAGTADSGTRNKRKVGDLAVLGVGSVLAILTMVAATNSSGAGGKSLIVSEEMAPALIPEDAHGLGPKDAKVTIVEFGDLACHACKRAYLLLKDVYKQHEGKLRIVFRHYPLMDMHPHAFRAAIYAEYAGSNGKFFEYLDRAYNLGEEQSNMREPFEIILQELNLDVGEADKMVGDADSPELSRVHRDMTVANSLGVFSTPTFFLAIEGERPYSDTISDIVRRLDSDPKVRKLLEKTGG